MPRKSKSKIYIDEDKKTLVSSRKSHKLEYGFCCPLTKDPVLAVIKLENGRAIDQELKAFLVISQGDYRGFVFRDIHTSHYDSEDAEYSLEYFYGLNFDTLAENLHSEIYSKTPLKGFKKKLMAGELKDVFIGTEEVKGKDIIIALKRNL